MPRRGIMTELTITIPDARPLVYTSSKGVDYALYAEDVRLRSGHRRRIYYFTPRPPKPAARPVAQLPPGYSVGEGRNGLPFLRKTN